jgi:hypothetical protein
MHGISEPCHTQIKHIHIRKNFWALDLWTETYAKGTFVNLYNHINRFIILLAKEYIVYILKIWILHNSRLLHSNLHTKLQCLNDNLLSTPFISFLSYTAHHSSPSSLFYTSIITHIVPPILQNETTPCIRPGGTVSDIFLMKSTPRIVRYFHM